MVHAGRGRARRRPARPAATLLEPGAASGGRGAAPAVLQGRAEPAALVGHAIRLGRWRAHLVCGRGVCHAASSARSRTSRWSLATALCSVRPAPSIWAGAPISSALRTSVKAGRSSDRSIGGASSAPSSRVSSLTPTGACRCFAAHASAWSPRAGRATAGAPGDRCRRPPCRTRTAASTRLRSTMVAPCSRTTRRGQARTPLCLAVSGDGLSWRERSGAGGRDRRVFLSRHHPRARR